MVPNITQEFSPAWIPDADTIKQANLTRCMQDTGLSSIKQFHAWSIENPDRFWRYMTSQLNIRFSTQPSMFCDTSHGVEKPDWLVGAKFNITDSCFKAAPNKIAIIQGNHQGNLKYYTYNDLNKLSNQIANSLQREGFKSGDGIAIIMPMNYHAVAIYLGIIKMGGVVISIADSFSSDEITLRLNIANAKAVFTQDYILRDEKKISLYEKICKTPAQKAIILSAIENSHDPLRHQDIAWKNFLADETYFEAFSANAKTNCNILFSSGTTGIPKAIPWTHTTPIKVASDAFLHQDIHENDILAWPTNLGWMMGPWLIFAALINNATLALYDDVPRDRAFGEFVEQAKVTMLGVVPTLVAAWRQSECMNGIDWHRIKCFSSTGECSNPQDMLYLMKLANNKPIIEYCGGTEIGGAYISSTLIENNYPSIFTTKTFGLDFVLLDENNNESDTGEVALIPPSIGLSLDLLNADHHKTYFSGMPHTKNGKILRRHGDHLHQLSSGYFSVLGRTDDTMNLGGIKTSSAEIERVINGINDILETAAIAVSSSRQGPEQLVIFAVSQKNLNKDAIKNLFQKKINEHLNPLFKIFDVVIVHELPKTASNKIMRRVLREKYNAY